ncbi:MAG: hypothetical protein EON98_01295 [Chitinophagaceae bacterium]|nr:MAG: hypothetical protein EON98_01295 [Chitinophagaceae bacterium]
MVMVKLVFPSPILLWEYKSILRKRSLQITYLKRWIICRCSEAEIELAEQAFRAKVTDASR